MGSTRFSILGVLILAFAMNTDILAAEPPKSFEDDTELEHWANVSFFGGFEFQELKKGDIDIVAVVGVPTSGVATSELYIYQVIDNRLELVLYRSRMNGIVKIDSDSENIYFFREDRAVLSIAWHGFATGWD